MYKFQKENIDEVRVLSLFHFCYKIIPAPYTVPFDNLMQRHKWKKVKPRLKDQGFQQCCFGFAYEKTSLCDKISQLNANTCVLKRCNATPTTNL